MLPESRYRKMRRINNKYYTLIKFSFVNHVYGDSDCNICDNEILLFH